MNDKGLEFFKTNLLDASEKLVKGETFSTDGGALIKNLSYFYANYMSGGTFDTGCRSCILTVLRHARTQYKRALRLKDK